MHNKYTKPIEYSFSRSLNKLFFLNRAMLTNLHSGKKKQFEDRLKNCFFPNSIRLHVKSSKKEILYTDTRRHTQIKPVTKYLSIRYNCDTFY